MADSSIGRMYTSCEAKSRDIWNDAKSDLVRCFAYYFYRILAVAQFFFGPVELPCGTHASEEAYTRAVKLITDPCREELERRKAINWTRSTRTVTPLIVPRDGNSLCHSVSVLVYGVPDQKLTIRRLLYKTCDMHRQEKSPLYERWSRFMKKVCKELGREYNIVGLRQEWAEICDSAAPSPIPDAPHTTYQSLKQYHIFILAQVLRRVIVVASPEEGGFKPSVYLPLYVPVDSCVKSPLYLCYRRGHFAPLVFLKQLDTNVRFGDLCFPIVDHQFSLYEFPFLFDNEEPMSTLAKYVRMTKIGFTTSDDFKELPALRVLDHESRTVSGCEEPGFDPSSVLMTCFAGLERHRNPNDVFNAWKFTLELQDKFGVEVLQDTYTPPSIGPSYQPADDAEDDEENGWNDSPDPPAMADLYGYEEAAMVLGDDSSWTQKPLSLHSSGRYQEATMGPSYSPGRSLETSVAKNYFRGPEEQRYTHSELSCKSLPAYSFSFKKSLGASAVKEEKSVRAEEATSVKSFDSGMPQQLSFFKSYASEKPQQSSLIKSYDSGLPRELSMARSSISAKSRQPLMGRGGSYDTLLNPSTTLNYDSEGTHEAPPASLKSFQGAKSSPHRKGKSQSLPVRQQQEALSQNPRDNHSMDMIFHSSADHSIGNEDTLLHSIDVSHLEETHSLAAREEHSLTQPHSPRPSLGPLPSLEPGRSTAGRVSIEGFGTASFTDGGGASALLSRPVVERRGASRGDSMTYRSIDGEFMVKQTSKNRVRVFHPDKIVLYIGTLEIPDKNPVEFRLAKEGLKPEDPVTLTFPADRNDVTINYSLTDHSLLAINLRSTDDGLVMDVVRPNTIKIKQSSSLIGGAEALVGFDVEQDSPYFDFRENPNKCRTAGCMNRAVRQFRNLCSSCHASWRAMLERTEGSLAFSYFDSVSTIGSRVGEDSCKNRNCAGVGMERFFGFCERCFHSSSVEW